MVVRILKFLLFFTANSSHPASNQPNYFPKDDVKAQYAAKVVDPRIHCALNCGAKVRSGLMTIASLQPDYCTSFLLS